MTPEEEISSFRIHKPLRGFALSRQDLRNLSKLLEDFASEAATLEVADFTKSEGEAQEKLEVDKQFVRSLFSAHVRIEVASGAMFSQKGGGIFDRPDMPQQVTGVEFDTGNQFSRVTRHCQHLRTKPSISFCAPSALSC